MWDLYAAVSLWLSLLDQGWLLIFAVPTIISALYFWATRNKPALLRAGKSAHGFLFATAWLSETVVSLMTAPTREPWWIDYVFVVLITLGVASVAYSFWGVSRRWYFHLLQVFNLSYALIMWYRGSPFFDSI